MKKEMIVLLLFGIIFISPLVLAQEQSQTYSGFDRFVDNFKMFFSSGDAKVMLALEIKEKEVASAIVNTANGNNEESDKNLENAWKKLQVIQEKVSLNTAKEVKENSYEIRNRIREGDLSENFEVYSLEEEKTELTAEWVIEVNGAEGQNATWEVVGNATGVQTRAVEIENRIDEIDGEISDWVVEHTYAEGTTAGGEAGVVVEGGLVRVVKTEIAQGDNGLKPEVKTSVATGGAKNEVTESTGGYAEGTVAGGESPGDSIDETYDDDSINSGSCGDGVVCGGENNDIEGGEGTEGTNDIAPATDSNEGTSSGGGGESSPTGEAIREIQKEDFRSFFKKLFGR